jgi:hypothetical protein
VIVCGNTLRLLAEKKSQLADVDDVEEAIGVYEQRPVG